MSDVRQPRVHPDFESEQAYIDFAYECADEMARRYGRLPEGAAHPKVAHAFRELSSKVLERLGERNGLVFGRIDSNDAALYIGRHGIHDDRSNTVVVNWQAPAASPYYEASTTDPKDLVARRHFETDGRVLRNIYEERFDGREVVTEDEAPVAASPIEDMLLAELGRERTDRMRDIVATIQQDQYRLMTRPLEGVLAIQGAPGTGKTVVGLHRASWLLFNNRPQLERSRVLVVGPNRVFMRYIADVLPSLGEEAADQSAVQYLVARARSRGEDSHAVARLKGDPRMARVVSAEVWNRIRKPTDSVHLNVGPRAPEVSANDVAEDIDAAQAAAAAYMDARRLFSDRLRRRFFEAASAAAVGARPSFDDFSRDLNQSGSFRSLLDRIWPGVSATQLVRELLGSRDRLARSGRDLLSQDEIELLYRRNPDREDDVVWTEHDLPLIDEAEAALNGIEESYGHLIIDEAQDLTPMQLRMVGRRTKSRSVTLLGDIAQATGPWAYSSWHEIADHVGWGAPVVEELVHAYRVPRQVMALALPVLSEIAPDLAQPIAFRDSDQDPEIREVTRPFLGDEAALAAGIRAEQGGTVAVIAPESVLAEIRTGLDQAEIDFRDAARGELGGVELITPRMAKGLEFDHVVIVEPLALLREAQPENAFRELYVSLTRPTRSLTVLHAEGLPRVLGGEADFAPSAPGTEKRPVSGSEQPVDELARISARLSDALSFARLLGARRPATAREVERGFAVAGLLIEAGAAEEEGIAALIRPVVEELGSDGLTEVRRLFGPAVAEALERSTSAPDESPITFAAALQDVLMQTLEEHDPETVIEHLGKLALRAQD